MLFITCNTRSSLRKNYQTLNQKKMESHLEVTKGQFSYKWEYIPKEECMTKEIPQEIFVS